LISDINSLLSDFLRTGASGMPVPGPNYRLIIF
jgi:hypothetical protein